MATIKRLEEIVEDIISDAREYSAEDWYEVLEELIRCWASDQELNRDEVNKLRGMVSART